MSGTAVEAGSEVEPRPTGMAIWMGEPVWTGGGVSGEGLRG